MAETTLLPRSDMPADRPDAPAIDWAAELVQHDRWLRTIVLARLGERQAVPEVMQEVALAAVAQHAPLDDRTRVGPWLYKLAVRQALMYRRRRGRQRKLLDGYARNQPGGKSTSEIREPLDWLLQDERRELVRAALEQLPRRDAEILLLKYTENWSYRVLAAHLGVSESAVETRLHRARGRLRAALSDTSEPEVNQ
jgi:RNA polymerase sigma factor (sigma-70 family)